jgi:hypothetical protein
MRGFLKESARLLFICSQTPDRLQITKTCTSLREPLLGHAHSRPPIHAWFLKRVCQTFIYPQSDSRRTADPEWVCLTGTSPWWYICRLLLTTVWTSWNTFVCVCVFVCLHASSSMHACMYVNMVCACVCAWPSACDAYLFACLCMYAYIHTHTHTYYTHTHACIYTHFRSWVGKCPNPIKRHIAYRYACVCDCAYIYIYIYIHTHAHTCIHTYLRRHMWLPMPIQSKDIYMYVCMYVCMCVYIYIILWYIYIYIYILYHSIYIIVNTRIHAHIYTYLRRPTPIWWKDIFMYRCMYACVYICHSGVHVLW